MPTLATMEAAQSKLEAGELDVAFNADGCLRIRQTLDASGKQLTEELLYNGKVVEKQDRSKMPGEFKVWVDNDLDGTWDWDHVATKGASITEEVIVQNSYLKGKVTRRLTLTRTSDTEVDVLVEMPDENGDLTTRRQFTGYIWEPVKPMINGPTPGTNPGDCDAAQAAQITSTFEKIVQDGVECMKKMNPQEAFRIARAARRGVNLSCANLNQGELARNNLWDLMFGGTVTDIQIDPTQLFAYGNMQNILFHELLHSVFGSHPDAIVGGGNAAIAELIQVRDRTYACAATCFGPVPNGKATKCHCAACIGGDMCDPRCSSFDDCAPKWPSQCTCKANATKTYNTFAECLVGCPSGLSCFACIWCCTDPLDFSCK
jgi:hypothetical protein